MVDISTFTESYGIIVYIKSIICNRGEIMNPSEAIKRTAQQYGVSVEEVRRDIQEAIDIAMSNPDPKIRAFWAKFPFKGKKPAPEEFIAFMTKEVTKN